MQHSRDYLNANVKSVNLMMRHRTEKHNVEGGITYRIERIRENSAEYEYRDSAGYSVPHTGQDLYMIYSLRAHNRLNGNRVETYLQDNWHFKGSQDSVPTLYTLNYGVRFSHWNFNGESLFSPRVSLSITPHFNRNVTFRSDGAVAQVDGRTAHSPASADRRSDADGADSRC